MSQNEECTISTPLFTYLEAQSRQIRSSVGNGNCLFRCFSYQLLRTEDEHIAVRSLLVRFENLNQSSFQPYLTSINPPTMKQHINNMLHPKKWGTHIEILAAATYFRFLFTTAAWEQTRTTTTGSASIPSNSSNPFVILTLLEVPWIIFSHTTTTLNCHTLTTAITTAW